MKIYLEGTDAVGKTSTINLLKNDNIIVYDRNREVISKYMLFNYSMQERAKYYYDYLKNNNVRIIFLINNDDKELLRRVYSRDKISEFDLQAPEYNNLYLDTYNYMSKNNMLLDKLYLLDVTNLQIDEQYDKVKKLILTLNK